MKVDDLIKEARAFLGTSTKSMYEMDYEAGKAMFTAKKLIARLADELEKYSSQPVVSLNKIEDQYIELLMAVETKHPGESRHDTALRYIKEAEYRRGAVRITGVDFARTLVQHTTVADAEKHQIESLIIPIQQGIEAVCKTIPMWEFLRDHPLYHKKDYFCSLGKSELPKNQRWDCYLCDIWGIACDDDIAKDILWKCPLATEELHCRKNTSPFARWANFVRSDRERSIEAGKIVEACKAWLKRLGVDYDRFKKLR